MQAKPRKKNKLLPLQLMVEKCFGIETNQINIESIKEDTGECLKIAGYKTSPHLFVYIVNFLFNPYTAEGKRYNVTLKGDRRIDE